MTDVKTLDLVRLAIGDKTFLTVAVRSCFDCPFQHQADGDAACILGISCVLDHDYVLVSKTFQKGGE